MPIHHRPPDLQLERERMIGDLRDLIAALDRRAPGVEGGAERQITHDAEALKRKALARLERVLNTRGVGRPGSRRRRNAAGPLPART